MFISLIRMHSLRNLHVITSIRCLHCQLIGKIHRRASHTHSGIDQCFCSGGVCYSGPGLAKGTDELDEMEIFHEGWFGVEVVWVGISAVYEVAGHGN